jgi:hypothetical protein
MEKSGIIVLPAAVQVLVNRSWEFSHQILRAKCLLCEDEIFNIKAGLLTIIGALILLNFKTNFTIPLLDI